MLWKVGAEGVIWLIGLTRLLGLLRLIVTVASAAFLSEADLIHFTKILIPVYAASVARRAISRLLKVEGWFWRCSGSQFCSRITDCSPGKAFPLFALILTDEQFNTSDDIWQVMGRVNLV